MEGGKRQYLFFVFIFFYLKEREGVQAGERSRGREREPQAVSTFSARPTRARFHDPGIMT